MRALLFLAFLCCAGSASAQLPQSRTLALIHVNVVDVENGRILPDRTVLVHGTRILALRPPVAGAAAGADVVDAHGRYLIPGLWDAHTHLLTRLPDGRALGEALLPYLLANGVTGVRDMGSSLEDLRRWRALAATGALPLRLRAAGVILDGFGSQIARVVRTPADARRWVDSLRAAGADFVKVYSYLPRAALLTVIEEARRAGLPFEGHAPVAADSTIGLADLGMRTLEHSWGILLGASPREAALRRDAARAIAAAPSHGRAFPMMMAAEMAAGASQDPARLEAMAQRFLRDDTYLCPTLVIPRFEAAIALDPAAPLPYGEALPDTLRSLYRGSESGIRGRYAVSPGELRLHEEQERAIASFARAGVRFLAGTDNAPIPGFALHDELALLVEAGLTPLQALQAATLNPARLFAATDSLGSVAPGKLADLVLLDGNPLADIRNTRRVRALLLNGRYYDRRALDAMLSAARGVPAR